MGHANYGSWMSSAPQSRLLLQYDSQVLNSNAGRMDWKDRLVWASRIQPVILDNINVSFTHELMAANAPSS